MIRYVCGFCGYEYDPTEQETQELSASVDFDDLPTQWVCPMCGGAKEDFVEEFWEDEEDF